MTDKIAGIVLLIICAPFLLVAAFGVAVFFLRGMEDSLGFDDRLDCATALGGN